MIGRLISLAVTASLVALTLTWPAVVSAQTSANILVVINQASADSKQIGASYTTARQIPAENILYITTAVADELDRVRFDADIERPIAEWLTRHTAHDRILYVVLTKGIPLRVRGTGGLNGTVASVDSELTLLYRKLLGDSVAPVGRIANPYFQGERSVNEAKPFSHRDSDIYLVTRIDGFSVSDVLQLIERGRSPVRNGVVILDQRANLLGDRNGDAWLAAAAKRLSAAGFSDRVVLESSSQVVSGHKQVLGYYSWGSNDPAITTRRFDFGFVPGSLAGMFVSTDGRTFKEPPQAWQVGKWQDPATHFEGSPQSLVGDLIREGATGVAGHVAEPFLDGTVRPQILFPAYLSGFNLAEAFYQAMPFLSWQTVVVGDPLCAPFSRERLSSEESTPPLDPETELPRFFSARRLAVLSSFGVRAELGKLLLKANSRLTRADLRGARQALEEVTLIEPTLNAAHFILAGLYERGGEFDRAIERYRTILSTRSDDVRALNNLAYLLAVQKKVPQEALPLAEKAYNLGSKAELNLDLGWAMIARRGTPVGALPFADQAFTLVTTRAQIADTLGWIFYLLGQHAQVEKYLAEAVRGAPASAEIHLHLAEFEASRGQKDQSLLSLNRALALDPSLATRDDVKQLQARLATR